MAGCIEIVWGRGEGAHGGEVAGFSQVGGAFGRQVPQKGLVVWGPLWRGIGRLGTFLDGRLELERW